MSSSVLFVVVDVVVVPQTKAPDLDGHTGGRKWNSKRVAKTSLCPDETTSQAAAGGRRYKSVLEELKLVRRRMKALA